MKSNKHVSREVGLDLLILVLRHFTDARDLHYGYWTDGLEPTLANLPKAQQAHCDFLVSHIPAGTKSILDVGCGVGGLARRLLDAGYQVECVSPSPTLTRYARELLGDDTPIHECFYEELETDRRFDVILFSESFQYTDLEASLAKSSALLRPGGHLLICDFFKTDAPGKSPMGGGKRLSQFRAAVSHYPLKPVEDIDITSQTAPTVDILRDLFAEVACPAKDMVFEFLQGRHPFLFKLLKWKFRKKLAKAERKYFSGATNAESFATYKSYRLLLFQKASRSGQGRPADC